MLERGGRLDRPFIPGDTGNASTWSVPVRYKPVPGLTAKRILGRDPGAPDMTPAVVQAAVELVQEGAELITCGCGYSIRYQEAVRAAVDVPVFLSSLLLAPFLEKMLPPTKRWASSSPASSLCRLTFWKQPGSEATSGAG